jgi:hypothetical protein
MSVVPPWQRDLRVGEWILLNGPRRGSIRELVEFWSTPSSVSETGQPFLFPNPKAGWEEGNIAPHPRESAAALSGYIAWNQTLLSPGVLRRHLESIISPLPDISSEELELPPPWSLSGDADNALILQRLTRQLIEGGEAKQYGLFDRMPPAELWENLNESERAVVEELASAAAILWLRVPSNLIECDLQIASDLWAALSLHKSDRLLRSAQALAEFVARRIQDTLPSVANHVDHLQPAFAPPAQLTLRLDVSSSAARMICTGSRYLCRAERRRRRRQGIMGSKRLDSAPPPEVAKHLVDLLSLLHIVPAATDALSWRLIGAALCTVIQRGERLPEEIYTHLMKLEVGNGMPVGHWWAWLRREHLRVVWPHVHRRIPLGDLLHAPRMHWAGRRLARAVFARSASQAAPAGWSGSLRRSRAVRLDSRPYAASPRRSPWHSASQFDDTRNVLNADGALLSLHQLVGSLGSTPAQPLGFDQLLAEFDRIFASAPESIHNNDHDSSAHPPLHRRLPSEVRYRRHCLPKSGGGVRWIDVPHPALAQVQRRLSDVLFAYEPPRPEAIAFAPHRSPMLHARMHAGARAAAVVDIRDFFGSVRPSQFEWALKHASPRRWSTGRSCPMFESSMVFPEVLLPLLFRDDLPGHAPYLPQGSPASPAVANLVAHELDDRVLQAARAEFGPDGWIYSRYADDLVLSTPRDDAAFGPKARKLLERAVTSMNWQVAAEKSRTWMAGSRGPLVLCGIVVPLESDGPLTLPRETSRRVRAAWHHVESGHATHHDHGLLAYAYAVTGRHAYRVLTPGHSQVVLGMIARMLAGEVHDVDFVEGWLHAPMT